MKIVTVFALASLIFVSGCIFTNVNVIGGGLSTTLVPDPPSIFSLGTVRINVDLENNNARDIKEVSYDIFDSGRLTRLTNQPQGALCSTRVEKMRPQEFRSFYCLLQAPQITEPSVTEQVNARVTYRTEFPTVQTIEMMTEDEYLTRSSALSLQEKPKSYSYRDENIQLDIEFSDPLPIVVRPGRDYYMYFTIRNIGNGFVNGLKSGDFIIAPARQGSPTVINCDETGLNSLTWTLEPTGKEFPRIACKLVLPGGVKVIDSYGLLVLINYKYEVRESTSVEIIR